MKAECEWERFTRTGRIADYLMFKAKEETPEQRTAEAKAQPEERKRAGEKFYAGFRYRDGNGNQDDTGR